MCFQFTRRLCRSRSILPPSFLDKIAQGTSLPLPPRIAALSHTQEVRIIASPSSRRWSSRVDPATRSSEEHDKNGTEAGTEALPLSPSVHPYARVVTPTESGPGILASRRIPNPKGVGKPVATIRYSSLKPSRVAVTRRTPSKKLASFNWTNNGGSRCPTMYIPGAPALFTPHKLPRPIAREKFLSTRGRAIRTHRLSNMDGPLLSPFAEWSSILQAVETLSPDFRFDDVDVLASTNKLRQLVDFCRGYNSTWIRLHIALVHNTLIFSSENRAAVKPIPSASDLNYARHTRINYGLDFEATFTRWAPGLEDSDFHTQVIQHSLGHLNCVFSVGVDACLEDSAYRHDLVSPQHVYLPALPAIDSVTIIHRGFNTNAPTAEIKTLARLRDNWEEQLWFSRTNFLIRGHLNLHEARAVVQRIDILDVTKKCDEWENRRSIQHDLRKMTALVSQLRDIIRSTKTRHVYITRDLFGPRSDLEVFVVEDNSLPDLEKNIRKYWRGNP